MPWRSMSAFVASVEKWFTILEMYRRNWSSVFSALLCLDEKQQKQQYNMDGRIT